MEQKSSPNSKNPPAKPMQRWSIISSKPNKIMFPFCSVPQKPYSAQTLICKAHDSNTLLTSKLWPQPPKVLLKQRHRHTLHTCKATTQEFKQPKNLKNKNNNNNNKIQNRKQEENWWEILGQGSAPALHDVGGSFWRSFNSLRILLEAMMMNEPLLGQWVTNQPAFSHKYTRRSLKSAPRGFFVQNPQQDEEEEDERRRENNERGERKKDRVSCLDLCFNTIASSLYKCYFWKLSYLPSYQGFFIYF
jgi:hypothetical protein